MEALLSIAGQQGAGTTTAGLPANLKQQADSLWKMLDEMAESDPDAYGKFIQSQAAAAAEAAASEAAARPQVASALLVAKCTGSDDTLAIHLWPAPGQSVAMARTQLGAVSASTSEWTGFEMPVAQAQPPKMWQVPKGMEAARHLHCAVNTLCLQLLALPHPPVHFRALLHEAVCQWGEAETKLSVNRQTRVIKVSESWLQQQLRNQQARVPSAAATPQVLTKAGERTSTSALPAGHDLVLPSSSPAPAANKKKSPLIEMLPDKQ